MKRFTWWRMEQDAHHLSRALCGAFCSILHHVKRFMSQPPQEFFDNFFQLQLTKICRYEISKKEYIFFEIFEKSVRRL